MRIRRTRKLLLSLTAVVALAVVVHFVLSAVAAGRLEAARERFAGAVGPLELAEYAPRAPAEIDNAAHWILAGAQALEVLSGDDAESERLLFERLRPDLRVVLTTEERAVAEGLVERNRIALELLSRAAACSGSSYGIDYAAGAEAALPPLVELVRVARVVGLEGRLAIDGRNRVALARSLGTLAAMGRSLESESLLLTQLVAMAIDPIYRQLLAYGLAAGVVDAGLAAEVARQLEARDPIDGFRRGLGGEGAMASSVPATVAAFGELETSLLRRVEARLAQPGLDLVHARLLDDYVELAALLDRPLPEIRRVWGDPAERGTVLGLKSPLYVDLLRLTARAKQSEAGHELAALAVDLWRAAADAAEGYPLSIAARVEPFAGEAPSYELRADGSVELAAPAADAEWDRLYADSPDRTRDVFTWRLPPPAPAPAVESVA